MTEWTGVRDKRVLITGATRGIGLAAAQALARRGARLAIVARDDSRAAAAVKSIEGEGGGQVDVLHADLTSQASVRTLAKEALERYARIDVLVNNAGAIFANRELTIDGIERTWALNHLAPFLLTDLLLDRIKASAPTRMIMTCSHAHIMFTRELARRLEGTGVTVYCFHPGLVATGFNRKNGALMSAAMTVIAPFARSPRKAAQTLVWLADSPDVSKQSGGY